jgi:recombination associated protein RdgC
MNFKNLVVYQCPLTWIPSQMEALLRDRAFSPCAATEPQRIGWVPALHDSSNAMVHASGNNLLLRLRTQTRLLPADVVRKALAEAVSQREAQEERKLGKKEIKRLKDEVIYTLLPRAFPRDADLCVMLVPGYILVGTGSAKKAEGVLNVLRAAIGSLPVSLLTFRAAIPDTFTNWFNNGLPEDFNFGEKIELAGDDCSAKLSGVEMHSDVVSTPQNEGMEVQKLALQYADSLLLTVHKDARLSAIAWQDRLKGEYDAEVSEAKDILDSLAAEFEVWSRTFIKLLGGLLPALGLVTSA